MAAGRIVIPNCMPALDANGDPVPGAKLYFYLNETTTLTTVYTTAALDVAHANPVVADAAGAFADIFASDALLFSIAITDADGAPVTSLRSRDNVRPGLFSGETILNDVVRQDDALNLGIGTGAGEAITTASESVFLGYNAGAAVTTADRVILIGEDTGRLLTTGGEDTFVGRAAGNAIVTGVQNALYGTAAGASLTGAASRNTHIGAYAGFGGSQEPGVTSTIALGYESYTTKNFQAALGTSEILETVLFGVLRIGHGGKVLARNEAAEENWCAFDGGPPLGSATMIGGGNLMLGPNAGAGVTTHVAGTFVGKDAGATVSTGADHTFIGAGAGLAQTAGIGSTALGRLAGKTSTTAGGWTALGDTALEFNTADNVVGVGYAAGRDQSTGIGGVYVGAYAGGYSADADRTTAVGHECLGGTGYGDDNTVGGYRSGHNMTGANNAAWGSESLRLNTTGYDNAGFGYRAGFQVTTGYGNTFLGRSAGHSGSQKADAVNSMALGYLTFTDKSNQVVIGNSSVTEFVLGGVTITTAQLTALLALL